MAKYEVVKDFVDKENNLAYVPAGTIIDVTPERAKELTVLALIKPYKEDKQAKAPTAAKTKEKKEKSK